MDASVLTFLAQMPAKRHLSPPGPFTGTNIMYTMKNLDKMIFKPPSKKKTYFCIYGPAPSSAKFAMETLMKFD